MFVAHEAQLRSPGATMSTVAPDSSNPAELIALMLSDTQPLGAKFRASPWFDSAYIWNCVVAPAEITAGSVAGEPIVDVVPESPLETLTTTPALVAALSNSLITSCVVSGSGLPPNDSLMTFTWSWVTA